MGKIAEKSDTPKDALAHEIKGAGASGDMRCLVNTPPHTPNHTPSTTNTTPITTLIKSPKAQAYIKQSRAHTKRQASRAATIKQRTALPTSSWKHATQDEKFRYAGHAADRAGGVAFSLNLSDDIQRKLQDHKNPIRAFTDRLNRELKEHGLAGVPYALTLEHSAKDKLHVHGFAIAPQDTLQALGDSLRAAGGVVVGKGRGRQLKLDQITQGTGWAHYCGKHLGTTDNKLAGNARYFLSQSMTKTAREFAGSN
ncbi:MULTISPECIES: hypothetical protein [unclassified Roseovarius]|uniref:hypothetical protein n=1 Tax=unclassified Roseovarius TaxID=2614913 RepID=UPI00273F4081|nr:MULTISPECIES: hypothetical protein [unclassified Roseovarius]